MGRNVQGQTHIKDNFNFVNDTHSLRQSDIVDYRAAYFAAKKYILVSIVIFAGLLA